MLNITIIAVKLASKRIYMYSTGSKYTFRKESTLDTVTYTELELIDFIDKYGTDATCEIISRAI